jgi:hypothetical protein
MNEHAQSLSSEVWGPNATEDQIRSLIDNTIIKPIFKEGVGKRGKSSLIGKASSLNTPLPLGFTVGFTMIRSQRT